MSRPTVSQAQAWRPDSLGDAADSWEAAATDVQARIDAVVSGVGSSRDFWSGSAAEAAWDHAGSFTADGAAVARSQVTAAVAARTGADQIAAARGGVITRVASAAAEGFDVADDGTFTATADPPALLVALSGGSSALAREVSSVRAAELTRQIAQALDMLGVADAVTGWPNLSQDRIASQIRSLTTQQRHRLIAEFPEQVGNTDGVPWTMRVAANRINIAQAILDERRTAATDSENRIVFYRGLLSGDRQIIAFDPGRATLIELSGNLETATSIGVLVPGLNTTIEGSAANTETARRFVAASRGDLAMITYLGGPFPQGSPPQGIVDAADPRYAIDMAPRLVAFSEDVDRTADSLGRQVPVTYIGHSYGGSILGTAEALGLTADRTVYVEAAGAGVGVDDPGDWHNRNADVIRFAMTAPGDPIELVQGIPFGPYGADPDAMPGVVRLDTGYYRDGPLMAGLQSHSDVLNEPFDAWRNLLAVMTGGHVTLYRNRLLDWVS